MAWASVSAVHGQVPWMVGDLINTFFAIFVSWINWAASLIPGHLESLMSCIYLCGLWFLYAPVLTYISTMMSFENYFHQLWLCDIYPRFLVYWLWGPIQSPLAQGHSYAMNTVIWSLDPPSPVHRVGGSLCLTLAAPGFHGGCQVTQSAGSTLRPSSSVEQWTFQQECFEVQKNLVFLNSNPLGFWGFYCFLDFFLFEWAVGKLVVWFSSSATLLLRFASANSLLIGR